MKNELTDYQKCLLKKWTMLADAGLLEKIDESTSTEKLEETHLKKLKILELLEAQETFVFPKKSEEIKTL